MSKQYNKLERLWTNHWFQFICDNSELPWDWIYVSMNDNITCDIIHNNPDKPWDWDELSRNTGITWDIIKANLDKPWNWDRLTRNPSITWNIIKANLDKPWDWDWLSMNQMIKQKEAFIDDLRLKMIKSNIIKRCWRKYSYDPRYPFAQKMVLKRAELI